MENVRIDTKQQRLGASLPFSIQMMPRNSRIIITICQFIIYSVLGSTCNGQILQPPMNQTIQPLNSIATFSCEIQPYDDSTIIGMVVSSKDGIKYNSDSDEDIESLKMRNAILSCDIDYDIDYDVTFTCTLTIEATEQNNGTTVTCILLGPINRQTSSSGILIVHGPPLPPEPELLSINSTLLHIRWAPPFSSSAYPITAYRINVTEQELTGGLRTDAVYNLLPNMTEMEYPFNELYPLANATLPSCTVLEFRVTAFNDVGESTESTTMGSYPIAPDKFDDSSLTVTLAKEKDNSLVVTLEFSLPAGCADQEGEYELNITNLLSNMTESLGPFNHSYANGTTAVKLIFENESFYEGQHYRVIVTVQTGGTKVTSLPYIISTTPMISESEDNKRILSDRDIIAIAVCCGVALIIVMLVTVSVSIIFFCNRKSRSKLTNGQQKESKNDYEEHSLKKTEIPLKILS